MPLIILICLSLFSSSSFIVYLDANYGKRAYQFYSTLLVKWRVGILQDYEVLNSTDVLSYFTLRTLKGEVIENERDFYIENLKNILDEIKGEEFFREIKYKLMIDAVYFQDLEIFKILFCTFKNLDIHNVQYYDKINDKTLNLQTLLLKYPKQWNTISSSCALSKQ